MSGKLHLLCVWWFYLRASPAPSCFLPSLLQVKVSFSVYLPYPQYPYIIAFVCMCLRWSCVRTAPARTPGFQGQTRVLSVHTLGSLLIWTILGDAVHTTVSVDSTPRNSALLHLHARGLNPVPACQGIYVVNWYPNLPGGHRANFFLFFNSGIELPIIPVYSWLCPVWVTRREKCVHSKNSLEKSAEMI